MDPALMTAWATVAIAAITGVVGTVTCLLIWRGITSMDRSTAERAAARKAASDADERRHAEAMTALNAQSRAMEEQNSALREQTGLLREQAGLLGEATRSLAAQTRSLETLLQRMAPAD